MTSTSPRLSAATSQPAPLPPPLPAGERGTIALPRPWAWTWGPTDPPPRVAWELVGAADAPVVAVLGGISADRHVTSSEADPSPGWWQDLVGPGHALDTGSLRVLGLDFLGGNGGSTGPRRGPDGRLLSVDAADQARALAGLLDHLGVARLEAVVGSSYGGMVALRFAAELPHRLRRLIVISAAERPHPRSTAWRLMQRRFVELGQRSGRTREGLALSRALAMVGYRSAEELRRRFDRPARRIDGAFRFPVEDYLDARGGAFADRFDPDAFLTLSESIDLHRVDPARIGSPTTLVGIRSDQLVPIEDVRRLAAALRDSRPARGPGRRAPDRRCRLVEIRSLYGHDAFLKEPGRIGAVLRTALGEVCR